MADAVNRRERGEAELAAFAGRVADLRQRLARREPIQVARIGFYETGTYAHYGQDRETTEIMRSVGLDVVGPPESDQETSVELLGELTAPWLIVFGSGEDGAGGLAGISPPHPARGAPLTPLRIDGSRSASDLDAGV